jgi:hypothetical protein
MLAGIDTFVVCMQCPVGKYTSEAKMTSCTTCEDGTYAGTGASVCEPCAAGTRLKNALTGVPADACEDVSRHASCIVCALVFPVTDRLMGCMQCEAGKYSGEDKMTECTDCPGGTYAAGGASFCESCVAGTELVDNTSGDPGGACNDVSRDMFCA